MAEDGAHIPAEFLTRPLNRPQAGYFHSGTRKTNGAKYLRELIAAGKLTSPIGAGSRLQFDIREFPEAVRDKLR